MQELAAELVLLHAVPKRIFLMVRTQQTDSGVLEVGQVVAVNHNAVADPEGGFVLEQLLNLLVELFLWNGGLYLKEIQRLEAGGIVMQSGADFFFV